VHSNDFQRRVARYPIQAGAPQRLEMLADRAHHTRTLELVVDLV
jgi:hypothetical protein